MAKAGHLYAHKLPGRKISDTGSRLALPPNATLLSQTLPTLPFAIFMQDFWMDVGQPPDYLKGMVSYLDSLQQQSSPLLATLQDSDDYELVGPVIVVRREREREKHAFKRMNPRKREKLSSREIDVFV